MIAAKAKRSRNSSRLIWILTAFVGAFIVWASNAALDEIVRGSGTLAPKSNAQVIQSLEGGILNEILVSEGDSVARGQVLVKLNETRFKADVANFESQIRAVDARILRLRAELEKSEAFDLPAAINEADPDLADAEKRLFFANALLFASELGTAEEQLRLETDKVELMQTLVAQEAMPEIDLINQRITVGNVRAERDKLLSDYELRRTEELSELVAERAKLVAQIEQSRDQLQRSQLVSPSDGIVNTVHTTTVGGVVRPGEPIIEITPLDDEMLIEARIQPKDIAYISEGMRTTVKLTAYDYTIYGSLEGRITQISADTVADETAAEATPYYKVLVAVNDYTFPIRQEEVDIRPGMLADAEVHVGQKTVMQYLLKPLIKSTDALREP